MRKPRHREARILQTVFNNSGPRLMLKIMAPKFIFTTSSLLWRNSSYGFIVVLENLRGTGQRRRRSDRFDQIGEGVWSWVFRKNNIKFGKPTRSL